MKNDSKAIKKVDVLLSGEHSLGRPGARTAQAKRPAKYSALKHGILSNAVLEHCESKPDLDRMLKGLIDYFRPEGAAEEILVEKLATLFWRYRRNLLTETVEIARSAEGDGEGQVILEGWDPDLLMRYEVNLERAIDRTLVQLERLQRMRRGQPVLPPVKVQLSA